MTTIRIAGIQLNTNITKLDTRTALTVPAPNLGISRTLTTSTVAPKNPPIHCHHGPSWNAVLIFIPLNPWDQMMVRIKQQKVPTRKDWSEEKAGLLPGVRANRALTPPWVANASPPIITKMPPVHISYNSILRIIPTYHCDRTSSECIVGPRIYFLGLSAWSHCFRSKNKKGNICLDVRHRQIRRRSNLNLAVGRTRSSWTWSWDPGWFSQSSTPSLTWWDLNDTPSSNWRDKKWWCPANPLFNRQPEPMKSWRSISAQLIEL
jgi:hypothetical protein